MTTKLRERFHETREWESTPPFPTMGQREAAYKAQLIVALDLLDEMAKYIKDTYPSRPVDVERRAILLRKHEGKS